MKKQEIVTIREVARAAGVSTITVSRVINNSNNVSAKTRDRVNQAIETLHYVPNTLARSLRSKQTHTIALVVSDITNPFWTTVARGVEDKALQYGFHVILGNTDEDPEKQANYIDVLLRRRVDGILIAPTTNDRRSLAVVERQRVPCVLIDRRINGFQADLVCSNNADGAKDLTEHLLQRGHRDIGLISGPPGISTSEERVCGYHLALKEYGIPFQESLLKRSNYKQDGGYDSALQLLAQQPRPTAIIAANNFIAIGVLRALHEAGLRVPEDMALACFDDIPVSLMINPFLTVSAQGAYEMGTTAVELLMARLADKKKRKPREIVLGTKLIIRKSSGLDLRSATRRNVQMKRVGSLIGIKPENLEAYKRYHAAVWPEIKAMITECNIRNYSIYQKDGYLFSYYEYVGTDYAADMAKMAADPKTQEWWAIQMPLQSALPTRKEGEWWAEMEEVFHMD